ncbi:HNH endonuclease signature motif containing protein [Microbacterium sp. JZ37]|uniref:HNH endonuclease signature motif containing protein n=1 Tax=Microbacterium sp. JZ37 TaxID=2654193 RepID=UPI002B4A504C|nr:DUF222 domain-containing protein [Microbacterium sp. JZ37]
MAFPWAPDEGQDDPAGAVCAAVGLLDGLFTRVGEVASGDLAGFTARVEQLGRVVDALRVRAAGEVAWRSRRGLERPLAGELGCRDGRELLERLTGIPGPAVSARVRLDEATRDRESPTGLPLPPAHPAVAAAVEAGLLGVEPAALIVKAVATARRGAPASEADKLEVMERHLVGIATGAIATDLDEATPPAEATSPFPDGTAAAVPWSVVKAHADAWVDVLTADGLPPDPERPIRNRTLTLTPLPDGAFRVNGTLVPEAGALLQNLLSAHTNPAHHVTFTPTTDHDAESGAADADNGAHGAAEADNGADGADAAAGDCAAGAAASDGADTDGDGGFFDGIDTETRNDTDPWGPDEIIHDPRTPGQKRHDAFFAMIQAASRAAETPTLGGAAPTVMIHITADDLTTTNPTGDGDGVHDTAAHGPGSAFTRPKRGVAHLDGVDAPVPATVARRIGCTGDILRAVFSPEGRILELRSIQRCFTPTQRKAIVARDGGCIIPGCTIPAAWCEIHHVQDHAHGGPTETDNGVLLCWWHHHHLDTSGWTIHMHHGVPYIAAPNWIDRHHRHRPAPTSRTRLHAKLTHTLRC